jgi:hypothetical protein
VRISPHPGGERRAGPRRPRAPEHDHGVPRVPTASEATANPLGLSVGVAGRATSGGEASGAYRAVCALIAHPGGVGDGAPGAGARSPPGDEVGGQLGAYRVGRLGCHELSSHTGGRDGAKLQVVLATRPGALLSPGSTKKRGASRRYQDTRLGATGNRKICLLWEGKTPDIELIFPLTDRPTRGRPQGVAAHQTPSAATTTAMPRHDAPNRLESAASGRLRQTPRPRSGEEPLSGRGARGTAPPRPDHDDNEHGRGQACFVEPTIFDGMSNTMKIAREGHIGACVRGKGRGP